jgi:hypothetical protein
MKRPIRVRAAAIVVLTSLPIVVLTGALLGRIVDDPTDGVTAFVLADFGGVTRATLETNALPYKVVATALLLREERVRAVRLGRADLPDIYRQFGFLTPERIANWPVGRAQPAMDRPLGMVRGDVRGPTSLVRIDAVNLGCATCHTGLVYGADGRATSVAWAGLPNASINLEAYGQAVFVALASRCAIRARSARASPSSFRRWAAASESRCASCCCPAWRGESRSYARRGSVRHRSATEARGAPTASRRCDGCSACPPAFSPAMPRSASPPSRT